LLAGILVKFKMFKEGIAFEFGELINGFFSDEACN